MTPLWMKLLASESVEVSFVAQMLTIVKIVIVPIGAALIHERCLEAVTAPVANRSVADDKVALRVGADDSIG